MVFYFLEFWKWEINYCRLIFERKDDKNEFRSSYNEFVYIYKSVSQYLQKVWNNFETFNTSKRSVYIPLSFS